MKYTWNEYEINMKRIWNIHEIIYIYNIHEKNMKYTRNDIYIHEMNMKYTWNDIYNINIIYMKWIWNIHEMIWNRHEIIWNIHEMIWNRHEIIYIYI